MGFLVDAAPGKPGQTAGDGDSANNLHSHALHVDHPQTAPALTVAFPKTQWTPQRLISIQKLASDLRTLELPPSITPRWHGGWPQKKHLNIPDVPSGMGIAQSGGEKNPLCKSVVMYGIPNH